MTIDQEIRDHIRDIFPREEQIPPALRLREPLEQREYLIDGEIRCWEGEREKVFSPVYLDENGTAAAKYLGSYPLFQAKEALQALDAASRAYDNGRGAWPTASVEERIKHMNDFTLRMSSKREEVVRLLMWEIGKSAADAGAEFDRTIKYIQDTLEALKSLDRAASRFTVESGVIGQIRRAPLGVVLCMGPYNYPLNETFTTLIPALIMGNTVVFKPARVGVLMLRPLLEAFRDSFPKGVVNMVYGRGTVVAPPMMKSGRVACLAFIGSYKAADALRGCHPQPHRLRCVLGLAAKNVGIVLGDADLELAVRECGPGTLSFNGQRCTALKILFVQESIAKRFVDAFAAAVSQLKIGMPWDEKVSITPLPEAGKTEYLTGLVEDAKAQGAAVVNPGGAVSNRTFYYPAVLYPVSPQARIYHEEQFGPVIPVVAYKNLSEPIDYIEKSSYGQQVSIFGQNSEQLAQLIDPLVNQVCRVNLNSQCQRGPDTFPFTGRKDSAEGTLSVSDALRVFSIRTMVAAKETPLNKALINDIVRNRRSKFLSDDFIL